MKVRIVSAVRSRASWAKVARCLTTELSRCGANVMVEEDHDGLTDPEVQLDEPVVRALSTSFTSPDVDLMIVRPERFAHYGQARLRTGYMVFEADRWPATWVAEATNHLHVILTPSRFCHDTLIASKTPAERIEILPHGVDPAIYRPGVRNMPSGQFKLLFVGSPSRRKGLEFLLEALLDDRLPSEQISLTIKTEHWPHRNDQARRIAERVRAAEDRGISIQMIEQSYDEAHMATLYRDHDLFCAPHMGEAFGMCILEAMACACPTIATAWSGPCDFYNADYGWPITDFNLTRTDLPLPDSFPAADGALMAKPTTNGVVQALISSLQAGPTEHSMRATSAAQAGAALTWSRVAKRFLSIASSSFVGCDR